MDKEKLEDLHVLMPKKMADKIRQLAKEKDMKISAIIRQALKEYLRKNNK